MTSGDLGVADRRRVTRQLLIGGPLLVGVVVLTAMVPSRLIASAKQKADACLVDARKHHVDPASCSLGTGFAIAAMFPHVKAEARTVRDDFEVRQRELLRADGPKNTAFAALGNGDVVTARKLVLTTEPADHESASRLGALACLLGERERGLALLRAGDALQRKTSSVQDSPVRFAAQHCGGTFETVGFEPYDIASHLALEAVVSRAFDASFQQGRRATIGFQLAQQTTIYQAGVVASLALAAGSEHEPTLEELLTVITERTGEDLDLDAAFAPTPWHALTVRDPDFDFVEYMPPQWLELAASRYERAVGAVKKPIDIRGDEVSVATQVDLLRRAAMFAYLHGAGYRIRRGDEEGARAALAKARALDAATLARAPLELAVHDAPSALATLDAWQAKQKDADPNLQNVATVNRVLALLMTGEFVKAQALASTVQTSERDWLVLATTVARGAPVAGLFPPADESEWKLTAQTVAAAIQAKQLPSSLGAVQRSDLAALPAIVFVVTHAARSAGADPEVVLDRVLADMMPSRTVALARVEAARWSKDDATAQKWQARADAIEQLFTDDHAVALAGIARLW